jgi:hypothetical protein
MVEATLTEFSELRKKPLAAVDEDSFIHEMRKIFMPIT